MHDSIINLHELNAEERYRFKEDTWLLISTRYDNTCNDYNAIQEFLENITQGSIKVNEKSISKFSQKLRTHETVMKYH